MIENTVGPSVRTVNELRSFVPKSKAGAQGLLELRDCRIEGGWEEEQATMHGPEKEEEEEPTTSAQILLGGIPIKRVVAKKAFMIRIHFVYIARTRRERSIVGKTKGIFFEPNPKLI